MTMPVITAKIQDMVFNNQKKKAYSEFASAFSDSYSNEEFVPVNPMTDSGRENFLILQKKFKVIKTCTNSIKEGCWYDACDLEQTTSAANTNLSGCWMVRKGEGITNGSDVGFIDNAGRQWALYKAKAAFWIIADVNGDKAPNKFTKDRLGIIVTGIEGY